MSMNNSKGLGRGLDALFQASQSHKEVNNMPAPNSDSPFKIVSINALIANPNQPRKTFSEESIKELAKSISERGVLQPLLVRQLEQEGMYEIVAGERRWRAAKEAGLEMVPVIEHVLSDEETMILALIENIQREDLNPIDEAKGLLALKEKLGISQEMLAEKLGKHSGTISNMLRLLKLSERGQKELIDGRISVGHARCILNVDQGECAEEFLNHIIKTDMSVKDAEEAVNFWRTEEKFPWQSSEPKTRQKPTKSADMARIAKEVGALLSCRAQINGNIEKGRISLVYETNEQLYDLLEKLGISLN